MSRFAPALRRVARDLDLPGPARAAILSELAAELESVYAHHRSGGAGEAEAARRAEERVLGSPEMVARLGRLHRSSWRDWSEEIGGRLTGGLDLGLLVGGVVPVLLFGAAVAARALWAGSAAPAGGGLPRWGIMAVSVLLVLVLASEVARGLRGAPVRRARLPLLLVLSVLAPALGALALVLGLRSSLALLAAGAPTAGGPAASVPAAAAQLVVDGSTCAVGLLAGIGGAVAWFVLLNRSVVQAEREVDALLAGEVRPVDPRSRGLLSLVRRRWT